MLEPGTWLRYGQLKTRQTPLSDAMSGQHPPQEGFALRKAIA